MDPVSLLLVLPLSGGAMAIVYVSIRKVINHVNRFKVDPHEVRKLEQQGLGYKVTQCEDENCTECYPKAIPVPPRQINRDSRGYSRNRCKYCDIHTASSDTCAQCRWQDDPRYKGYTKKDYEFQQNLRAMHRVPADKPVVRERVIGKIRALIPAKVPDDAFASTTYDPRSDILWVNWKWTDPETGRTMGFKSLAWVPEDDEAFEIRTGDGMVISSNGLRIGTEVIRK